MPLLQSFIVTNMSFDAIHENKIPRDYPNLQYILIDNDVKQQG